MAQIKNLMIDIQNEIRAEFLNFSQIAMKYNVPIIMVHQAWDDLCEQEAQEVLYHDHLERDHDEEYEPDCPDPDSWYEDQYDLGDY